MSKWQPIETAPKDGSEFLALSFHKECVPTYQVIYWDEEDAQVDESGVTYPWRVNDSELCMREIWPTHWMPLPDPPEDYNT